MMDPRELLVLWMALFVAVMALVGILVVLAGIRAGRR